MKLTNDCLGIVEMTHLVCNVSVPKWIQSCIFVLKFAVFKATFTCLLYCVLRWPVHSTSLLCTSTLTSTTLHEYEWMNEWMNEWTFTCLLYCVLRRPVHCNVQTHMSTTLHEYEWMNELMNEWMNEWMNIHLSVVLCVRTTCSLLCTSTPTSTTLRLITIMHNMLPNTRNCASQGKHTCDVVLYDAWLSVHVHCCRGHGSTHKSPLLKCGVIYHSLFVTFV